MFQVTLAGKGSIVNQIVRLEPAKVGLRATLSGVAVMRANLTVKKPLQWRRIPRWVWLAIEEVIRWGPDVLEWIRELGQWLRQRTILQAPTS